MKIVFYILIGLFGLFGFGTLITASQTQFKNIGLVFGGLSYLGGAIGAYVLDSWWPFLIGFGMAWLVRLLGGDPGR